MHRQRPNRPPFLRGNAHRRGPSGATAIPDTGRMKSGLLSGTTPARKRLPLQLRSGHALASAEAACGWRPTSWSRRRSVAAAGVTRMAMLRSATAAGLRWWASALICRDCRATFSARGLRERSYAARASCTSAPVARAVARAAASSIAWQPPWPRLGSMAWAASPRSATRPVIQVASGRMSRSGVRMIASGAVESMIAGMGACQSANRSRSDLALCCLRAPRRLGIAGGGEPVELVLRQARGSEQLATSPGLASDGGEVEVVRGNDRAPRHDSAGPWGRRAQQRLAQPEPTPSAATMTSPSTWPPSASLADATCSSWVTRCRRSRGAVCRRPPLRAARRAGDAGERRSAVRRIVARWPPCQRPTVAGRGGCGSSLVRR